MKRRLITGIYLSLAALAACQAEPPADTENAAQELETRATAVDACDAKMPPTPYYDGRALPTTSESQIYLLYQDLERPGEYVLALVDVGKATIPFAVRTKSTGVGGLLSKLDEKAQWAGGRQPPPPPPYHDWNLAAALVEWANLALPDLSGAVEGGMCKAQ